MNICSICEPSLRGAPTDPCFAPLRVLFESGFSEMALGVPQLMEGSFSQARLRQ